MDIVIVGGGKLGVSLLTALTQEDHNVSLIELNEDRCNRLTNKFDIDGFVGNGGHIDVQQEARVNTADLFLAVTADDETNIIAAAIAKNIGAKHTIARLRDPGFAKQADFMRDKLGITMVINPDYETAEQIATILHYPSATSVEEFARGRVHIIEIPVSGQPLDGLSIQKFRNRYPDIIACLIQRDGEAIVPKGDTVIQDADLLSVTGTQADLLDFYHQVGFTDKKLKNALIVGGGRITHYLLERLSNRHLELKVIELDEDVAVSLSQTFPEVIVVNGDGSDQDFLREERLGQFDAAITLTGIDEENMLVSLYARRQGVEKVITKVNRTDLISLIGVTSLQGIVTPTRLITNKILRFVRSIQSKNLNADIEMLYRMNSNVAEAIQFRINKEMPYTNRKIQDLDFATGVILAAIIRQDMLIFPTGQDELYKDDQVIIITTQKNVQSLEDVLK